MKALFKTATGPGHMELREAPRPSPGPGQVVVEVQAAGICGSDLHIRAWDIKIPMRPPMITGHEFSGTIVELGEGVEGWQAGDRVTAEPSYSICGRCRYCRTGAYNLCAERKVLGYWADGAFAEYTRVPIERLHRLPAKIGFREGAMLEPLACCVHGALELTRIDPDELVVVSGPGAIGLLTMQVAKACGARVVVVGTGIDPPRLEVARALGADHTINLAEEDPRERVMDLTGGLGADVVLECSGAPPAVDTGIDLVRKQGRYTQIGLFGKPVTVDFERIAYKELQVTGSFAQRWTAWIRTLTLVERGAIQLAPLISDVLSLTAWEEGFAKLERKEGLKIILEP
jgi:L-iditol 2-dehydrogenase